MQKKLSFKTKYKYVIFIIFCIILALVCFAAIFYPKLYQNYLQNKRIATLNAIITPEWIQCDVIDIHDSARTGMKLTQLNNIVVHYVGNPNTTAKQNRDYFNNSGTNVSSHFIIGLEGEVVQCLPLNEISAASNHRNIDTISIEVCHPDESGRYNKLTYNSLIKLLTWLCGTLNLSQEDIIRHYDVTGKLCPLYYVENPDEWDNIINDVKIQLESRNSAKIKE